MLDVLQRFMYKQLIKYTNPLTVHAEAVHLNSVYAKLLKLCKSRKCILFCVTPANYSYVNEYVGFNPDLTKKEFSDLLLERYMELSKYADIELHVHLKRVKGTTYWKNQKKTIREAYNWLSKIKTPILFVAGWWQYDSDTLKIIKSLGMKMVKYTDYPSTHDFELIEENDWLYK